MSKRMVSERHIIIFSKQRQERKSVWRCLMLFYEIAYRNQKSCMQILPQGEEIAVPPKLYIK
jgi:hypothetical protein